jgi:ribonucleoside-diphosphate reductase alpha chain
MYEPQFPKVLEGDSMPDIYSLLSTSNSAPSQAGGAGNFSRGGLTFTRRFSKAGLSPYDEVQWERRTASITDASGKSIFEQKDVEVPVDWSMTATNIVASKYLHGQMDTPERETGVRQLVGRVAETVRDWGTGGGVFHERAGCGDLP